MEALDILDVTYIWDKSTPPVPDNHMVLLKSGERILCDGELYAAKPAVRACEGCASRACWVTRNKPFVCDGTVILVKL